MNKPRHIITLSGIDIFKVKKKSKFIYITIDRKYFTTIHDSYHQAIKSIL
jgi:hypothetical protein